MPGGFQVVLMWILSSPGLPGFKATPCPPEWIQSMSAQALKDFPDAGVERSRCSMVEVPGKGKLGGGTTVLHLELSSPETSLSVELLQTVTVRESRSPYAVPMHEVLDFIRRVRGDELGKSLLGLGRAECQVGFDPAPNVGILALCSRPAEDVDWHPGESPPAKGGYVRFGGNEGPLTLISFVEPISRLPDTTQGWAVALTNKEVRRFVQAHPKAYAVYAWHGFGPQLKLYDGNDVRTVNFRFEGKGPRVKPVAVSDVQNSE